MILLFPERFYICLLNNDLSFPTDVNVQLDSQIIQREHAPVEQGWYGRRETTCYLQHHLADSGSSKALQREALPAFCTLWQG